MKKIILLVMVLSSVCFGGFAGGVRPTSFYDSRYSSPSSVGKHPTPTTIEDFSDTASWVCDGGAGYVFDSGTYGITGRTNAGGVATITTAVAHVLHVGDVVNITGAVSYAENGVTITSVPTSTTFTYVHGAGLTGAYAAGSSVVQVSGYLTCVLTGASSTRIQRTTTGNRNMIKDYGEDSEKDFSVCNYMLRYYCGGAEFPTGGLVIVFYADGEGTNRAFSTSLPVHAGWNTVTLCPSMFTYAGTMTTMTAVRRIGINIVTTGSSWIVMDTFQVYPTGATKASIVFQFDDGFQTSLTGGISYLSKYGFRSMSFIMPETANRSQALFDSTGVRSYNSAGGFADYYMTWDDIAKASDAGSLICVHGETAMPTDTISNLKSWIETRKAALIEHGYYNGSEYMAIPGGQVLWGGGTLTPQQMYDTSKRYFKYVRGTTYWWNMADHAQTYQGTNGPAPIYPWDSSWGWAENRTNAAAAITNNINRAVAEKDLYVIYEHALDTDTVNTLAEFRVIVDHVKTHVDAGEAEVITYEDIYKRNN